MTQNAFAVADKALLKAFRSEVYLLVMIRGGSRSGCYASIGASVPSRRADWEEPDRCSSMYDDVAPRCRVVDQAADRWAARPRPSLARSTDFMPTSNITHVHARVVTSNYELQQRKLVVPGHHHLGSGKWS